MSIKKPYVLFHGYKQFTKLLNPAPKHPLWTSDFRQASSYIGDQTSAGVLAMIIHYDKLNILDMFNKSEMIRIYGKGINDIIVQSDSYSFYLFIAFLIEDYFIKYKLDYLNVLRKDFNITDIESIKLLMKLYSFWKKQPTQNATDKYSAEIFMPMAAAQQYNCVLEHEERDFDGQYVLLSKHLLKGHCCKFISADKLSSMSDEQIISLNELNIYDRKSISTILKIK